MRATAQASAVAPVVITSSTSRTWSPRAFRDARKAEAAAALLPRAPSLFATEGRVRRRRRRRLPTGRPSAAPTGRAISRAGLYPRRSRANACAATGTTTPHPRANPDARRTCASWPPSSRSTSRRPPNLAARRKRRATPRYSTAGRAPPNFGAASKHAAHLPCAGPRRSVEAGTGSPQDPQSGGRSTRSSAQHSGQAPRRCRAPRGRSQTKQPPGRRMDRAGWHAARWSRRANRSHAGTETVPGPCKDGLLGEAAADPEIPRDGKRASYLRAV
jgi:hypothetical protein